MDERHLDGRSAWYDFLMVLEVPASSAIRPD